MNPLQNSARICSGTLMGNELFRTEDDFGFVVVTQRGDKRVMSFDSLLEQSSVIMTKLYYLHHEYTQVMLLGLLFVDARHITLLGLGGGGLAHCLSHFYPQIVTQVVELRKLVIDVAYEWFNLPRVPNLQVTQCDARQYMFDIQSASTDIIFSDLYEAEGMSDCQAQLDYIENCSRALTDHGCLIINYHSLADKNTYTGKIKALFAEVYLIDMINGNSIMFCCKNTVPFSNEKKSERAETLVQHVKMPLMYYYRQLQRL